MHDLSIVTMDAIMGSPEVQSSAPLLSPTGSRYVVGQDASGGWLAIDTAHRAGGLFKSRAAAIRFAEVETNRRPGGICFSSMPLHMEF